MGLKQYVSLGGTAFMAAAFCACMYYSGIMAYDIRMYAINTYGRVIHEFDPWFNYRATEVLGEKVTRLGWYGGLLHPHEGFFHWCATLSVLYSLSFLLAVKLTPGAAALLGQVRLHVVVPAGPPRRHDDLPGHADFLRRHLADARHGARELGGGRLDPVEPEP